MIPEKLSTDLTSLNLNEDRLALVVEMEIDADGSLLDSGIYRARVHNHAKLAYNRIAPWLDGNAALPESIASVPGLEENLRLQDKAAQSLKKLRHVNGALSLETIEAKPVFDGDQLRSLDIDEKNRARELIEDFMIAANGVTARYLSDRNFPPSVALSGRRNAGSGSLKLLQISSLDCHPTRIQKRWRSSWSGKKPRIRCVSPTCPWRSSSSWEMVNMLPSFLEGMPRVILVWRSRIIPTRLLRIAATLIFLRSAS